MSGSANIMILATTSSQPQPHKLTSKGASPPKKSPPTRPESPGGYFTLSDSDGASNLESSSSDDLHHATSPPRSLYKIYKSSHNVVRSSSEPPIDYGRKTPPRPVPPKTRLIEAIDEDAPPRPPPPWFSPVAVPQTGCSKNLLVVHIAHCTLHIALHNVP